MITTINSPILTAIDSQQLHDKFAASQQLRQRLVETLAQRAPLQQLLCKLPGSLQTQPLHRFEQINVAAINNSSAHGLITDAIKDLYRNGDDVQSQRVRRYPGLIRFNPSPNSKLAELCQQLDQSIDTFKASLHRITAAAPNKQDLRFEILHDIAPNLITMHYYRSPMMIGQGIKRVRFGWVAKRIVAKTSKHEILTRLHNSLSSPGKVIADMPAWRQNIEQEYRAVDSLPANVELRIDREGGLRPTAFIQFSQGGRTQTPANLPLLIEQAEPIEVVPLPDWQQSDYPPAKGELLIPRLHLYRIN
ncbi:DNA replication terminus site-binding protein [Ferrimonas lipolytica]|uniref:DNA replication terminus site-binding protein n=1 Tax=Ferrimonas lipolytica TaxID=2724191 RepID=A0A6H1UE55_9GAMM|nr:DNA replication terminus site-binding protein [Ferrimonas lipolytica]QIZ76496.1 DNA replication terminus site-binding protein [Ferrimonas lipolytica]